MRGWGPQRNAAAPTLGAQSGSAALGGAGLVVRLTVLVAGLLATTTVGGLTSPTPRLPGPGGLPGGGRLGLLDGG